MIYIFVGDCCDHGTYEGAVQGPEGLAVAHLNYEYAKAKREHKYKEDDSPVTIGDINTGYVQRPDPGSFADFVVAKRPAYKLLECEEVNV